MYKIVYTKKALKRLPNLKSAGLNDKLEQLIEIIRNNPYQIPPFYEKLTGDMSEYYSRRINIQHRLVYQVLEDEKIVKILSIWSHYEDIKKILEDEEEYKWLITV